MSLKVFHIVFVTASILLAFGFGFWSIEQYLHVGGMSNLAFGIVSPVVGIALVFYGKAVWKKLQSITRE